MKVLFFISLFFISNFSFAENFDCKTYRSENNSCIVLHSDNSFLSAFPINEKKTNYKWNYDRNHPEYSWKTELGFCRGGEFVANKYNYILFSSNINGSGVESEGTLEQLLGNRNSHATLERSDRLAGEKDANIENNAIIKSMVLPEGAIAVYSDDLAANKLLFKNKPTHAKLTVTSPDKDDAYECVVEVIEK